jgi:DNA-binding beta-propeller fold protein YncE
MILTDEYDGSAESFEGDRTIVWRSLPSNAKVTRAIVTVTPVASPGGTLFEEVISFTGNQGDFGATRNVGSGFVEVDFHKRRTLANVNGTDVRAGTNPGAHLQVDLGGLYVDINSRGAIFTPTPADTLFTVPADGSLPGLTVSKFKLTPGGPSPNVSSVVIRSVPANITLRTGTLAPFFSHSGDFSTSETSADFSAILQTFLPHAAVLNGFYSVPITIHSDTIARLRLKLTIEFVSQTTLQPEGLKEVVVPFDFNTLPKTEANVLSVALPPNAQVLPGQTSAKVTGAFNDTRIVRGFPAGAAPPPFTVDISPAESEGQIVSPEPAVAATAVDILLSAVTSVAQLTLDVRGDLDGKPDGPSLIHRPVPFAIKSTVEREPVWVSVPLPSEFKFNANGSAHWLVLSSLEGEALWSTQTAATGSPGVQHTLDGGFSWHYSGALGTSGPLDAAFRLRNKPDLFEVPVTLKVGSGDKSAPVSLDRFQPLAKVDFTIDTPDFSQAFNQYLSAAVPSACPQGEHLINGDFDQWAVSGNQVGTPFPLAVSGEAEVAAATSADGHFAYIVSDLGTSGSEIQIIDVICDELLASTIPLTGTGFGGIAVNPAGDRLYIVSSAALSIADAIGHSPVGSPVPLSAIPGLTTTPSFLDEIAVSPDGSRIYVILRSGASSSVLAIDAKALEQVARGSRTLAVADIRRFDLPPGEVNAMALSPDGTLLYFAMDKVIVVDTQSFTALPGGIDVGDQPEAIDFTPDGKLALVATINDDTRLHLVDTAAATDLDNFVIGEVFPAAVVASPDGARAYVVLTPNETDVTLVVADLRHKVKDSEISLSGTGMGVAITPHGDRIYVAGGDTVQLAVIPIGTRSPAEWTLTSDSATVPARAVPFCVPQPAPVDLAVLFVQTHDSFQPNTVAAGLSQVVPVAAPCSYEFSFFGSANEPGALAEVFWLNNKGVLLQTDTLPVQMQGDFAFASVLGVHTQPTIPFFLHRAHLHSPAGAIQAEVRFTAPAFVRVAIGLASLQGTSEALSNSAFQSFQNGLPVGWTLTAQYPRGVSVTPVDGGIRFLNSSAGDAELVQTTAVRAGQAYTSELTGRPDKLASARQDPSVQLRWLKSDGSTAGPPTELTLQNGGFVRNPISGTTPDGTATVEVHLKAPPGTGLDVTEISLQTPPTTTVPLTFIAQSPGELRVSRSQVTYDVVPTPPPAVPPQGLAAPTPPGSKPGDPPCTAFCPCCQDERDISQPASAMTPAGRPAVVGVCQVCGSGLIRHGGPLIPGAPVLTLPLLPPHHQAGVAHALRRQPPPLPPLTALPGIREGRARQLAEIGITSLEHLAAASPEEAAKAMTGMSVKHVASLIERAKELIATHKRSAPILRSDQPPAQPTSPREEKE